MEVKDLCPSSIWSLNDHVSVSVDQIKVSVFLQLRNDVEVFFNNKSKLFIELSLFGLSLPFINIDDVPLLVKSVVSTVYTNVSVFSINISYDFQDFTLLVDY
jgi:hypothetical protein